MLEDLEENTVEVRNADDLLKDHIEVKSYRHEKRFVSLLNIRSEKERN